MKTLIIAEAGVNHNGDLALAYELVDVAAQAGADVVKFQTFSADRLVTAGAVKAAYQMASGPEESQQQMLQRLQLTREMHEALIARCHVRGIRFLSTGFDRESIDLLVALGVRWFKVPSGEISNIPYLRHVGRLGLPVILSTGMSTLEEIGAALEVLERAGTSRDQICVLHCNTAYPTPMPDVNLRAMLTIRDAFGVTIGYSDHTLGTEVPIAAVALGASVIEKHFTLNRRLPGPDHQVSLEPDELAAMISAIRNIELALGDGIKRASVSEMANPSVVRKSLVAARAIRAGEILTEANLAVKRPGNGLSPTRWDEVLGCRASRDFAPDEPIEL